MILWRMMAGRPKPAAFAERLLALSAEELIELCIQYLDARYGIMQYLTEADLTEGASEDVLEDLADHLILCGKGAVEAVYGLNPSLPPSSTWSGFEKDSVFGELCNDAYRRFNEGDRRFENEIYGLGGHEYPYPWTFGRKWSPRHRS